MAENSAIEWTDHTFNPWIGCTHVSPGCKFCYAEEMMDKRYGKAEWGKGKPRLRTSTANWKLPLKWNREAETSETRPRVFCASLADVFDEEAPDEWRADLFTLIDRTPNLDWLLLTKRPQNVMPMMNNIRYGSDEDYPLAADMPLPNVWFGTSVENQQAADERIPTLLGIPAAVRFLSCEPILGPVDLNEYLGCGWDGEGGWRNCPQHLAGKIDCSGADWVIVGGESGPNARPCDLAWIRSLVEQCSAADVPCFVKQLGAQPMVDYYEDDDSLREWALDGIYSLSGWDESIGQPPMGTKVTVHLHDRKGGDLEEFPEELRVREFPEVAEVGV